LIRLLQRDGFAFLVMERTGVLTLHRSTRQGTVYELSVSDQFGVFGVNPKDSNDAAKALRERLLEVIGQIDSFANDLHKSFGENSGSRGNSAKNSGIAVAIP